MNIRRKLFFKRVMDLIFSLIGIIVLTPILLLISLIVKINMGGDVFFIQKRAGRYGRPFSMIKFRTMVSNNSGSTVTVSGDQRITPLGRILRKYKLDELPEIYNVLLGDMSMVGPRPDMPEYADKLHGEERLILELRPGITGPASIKYRNEEFLLAQSEDPVEYNDKVIWPDKVRMNLDYYYNRTILGDIGLIINTIIPVRD